jgi:hypothetical protein
LHLRTTPTDFALGREEFWTSENGEDLWEIRFYKNDLDAFEDCLVGFTLYHISEITKPYVWGTGALGNPKYGLCRGWSSRASYFNKFGFTEDYVSEVTINHYAGMCIPVRVIHEIMVDYGLNADWMLVEDLGSGFDEIRFNIVPRDGDKWDRERYEEFDPLR